MQRVHAASRCGGSWITHMTIRTLASFSDGAGLGGAPTRNGCSVVGIGGVPPHGNYSPGAMGMQQMVEDACAVKSDMQRKLIQCSRPCVTERIVRSGRAHRFQL